MTEEVAAQVEDDNMPPIDEVKPEEDQIEPKAESAPAPDIDPVAEPEPEKGNKVQERINKLTRDKYDEKRRADALEAELNKLREQQPQQAPPKLEDFDYDESAFNVAAAQYYAKQAAREELTEYQKQQQETQEQSRQTEIQSAFNERVEAYRADAPDYDQAVANIPELPQETLDAILAAEDGPKLAYYLGTHLDVADRLANSNPVMAAIELGKISAQLATKPINQPSAAPDPIEPVIPGGKSDKDLEDMSMEEIYAME